MNNKWFVKDDIVRSYQWLGHNPYGYTELIGFNWEYKSGRENYETNRRLNLFPKIWHTKRPEAAVKFVKRYYKDHTCCYGINPRPWMLKTSGGRSRSARDADIKVEVFGDGRSFVDHRGAYKSTGYVLALGAWKNTKSFIARQLEHPPKGREREFMAVRSDFRVRPGQTYHFRIVRQGQEIKWDIDGRPFLSFVDRRPLWGKGHDHFGFNNWESEVAFDNLIIRPLK